MATEFLIGKKDGMAVPIILICIAISVLLLDFFIYQDGQKVTKDSYTIIILLWSGVFLLFLGVICFLNALFSKDEIIRITSDYIMVVDKKIFWKDIKCAYVEENRYGTLMVLDDREDALSRCEFENYKELLKWYLHRPLIRFGLGSLGKRDRVELERLIKEKIKKCDFESFI